MMTPLRQKIARDAVNEALRVLYAGKLDDDAKGRLAEHLGAARAALSDHLWDKQHGFSRATTPTPS